jgi:hypothetical protein
MSGSLTTRLPYRALSGPTREAVTGRAKEAEAEGYELLFDPLCFCGGDTNYWVQVVVDPRVVRVYDKTMGPWSATFDVVGDGRTRAFCEEVSEHFGQEGFLIWKELEQADGNQIRQHLVHLAQ